MKSSGVTQGHKSTIDPAKMPEKSKHKSLKTIGETLASETRKILSEPAKIQDIVMNPDILYQSFQAFNSNEKLEAGKTYQQSLLNNFLELQKSRDKKHDLLVGFYRSYCDAYRNLHGKEFHTNPRYDIFNEDFSDKDVAEKIAKYMKIDDDQGVYKILEQIQEHFTAYNRLGEQLKENTRKTKEIGEYMREHINSSPDIKQS